MKREIRCRKIIASAISLFLILNSLECSFLNKPDKEQKEIISLLNLENKKEEVNSNSICNYENCPLLQGVCFENKCVCGYGYKTFIEKNDPEIYCNYKQKSRMTAFFLEFFFPIGLGHLYAGKLTLALIKLSLFILFFIGLCGELMCIRLNSNKMILCSSLVLLADMCLWITLQFVDLICYAFGYYNDGKGIPMI